MSEWILPARYSRSKVIDTRMHAAAVKLDLVYPLASGGHFVDQLVS